MSVYVVDQFHIALLAAWAQDHRDCWRQHPKTEKWLSEQERGQALLEENYKSYNARYGEIAKAPKFVLEPVPYRSEIVAKEILQLCSTYSYQTSLSPTWEGSVAQSTIRAIEQKAIAIVTIDTNCNGDMTRDKWIERKRKQLLDKRK